MVCSVVDVSHVSANPVAALFMVKVKPMTKMKPTAQTSHITERRILKPVSLFIVFVFRRALYIIRDMQSSVA